MEVRKVNFDNQQCQGQYCKSWEVRYLIFINPKDGEIALCKKCFEKLKKKMEMGEN